MTQSESNPWAEGTNDDAYALDRAHVFHSWSAQGALKPRVFTGPVGRKSRNIAAARHPMESNLVGTRNAAKASGTATSTESPSVQA